jgi:hypothetical protein
MPTAWAWLAAIISSNSSSSASIIVQLLQLIYTYNLQLFDGFDIVLHYFLFILQRVNPTDGILPMTPGSYLK